MKTGKFFRRLPYAVCLCALALLAVSCSEGPMSPVNSNNPLVSEPNRNVTGEVRPLNRKTAVQSLAKLVSYREKAVMHLQDLSDEVYHIKTNTSSSTLASKMSSVVTKIEQAQKQLNNSSEREEIVATLASAKSTLQGTSTTLLNSTTRSQLIAEVDAVVAIVNAGGTVDHDCRGKTKYLYMKKADGGLLAHCGHKFTIPKNALSGDKNMFIKIDNSSYITIDCGPDGTFSSNVEVYVSYRDADMTGVNLKNLTLAWYNTATSQWIDLGGTPDATAQNVKSANNHFTQYTISTK